MKKRLPKVLLCFYDVLINKDLLDMLQLLLKIETPQEETMNLILKVCFYMDIVLIHQIKLAFILYENQQEKETNLTEEIKATIYYAVTKNSFHLIAI